MSKTPRVCAEPGCPTLTQTRRCPVHEREKERSYKRDTRYSTARWKTLRRSQLRKQPWCETSDCDNPATDVDHVVRVADGGDFWNPEGLASLCRGCHSRKTAREVWHSR
jgi:5-methylcytosine-specific restriction protein A